MRTNRFIIPVVVVALGLSAACGDGTSSSDASVDTQASQAAASTPEATSARATTPITLRIGTNDPDDAPDVPTMLNDFARHVDELSDGSITVEPVWRAAGDPAPDDWDQTVARMVVTGELDLGLIPTAAWDTEGVTSLRALNAPFLVDSDALAADVVTGPLAHELLGGLEEVGVTGLALVPEGLRHVFSFGDPLSSPDDFAGTTIRSPRSDTVYALFEALGATADDPQGSDFDAAVDSGTLAGVESSFARAGSLPGSQQVAVGNLTLFPKVESLVANSERFAALTDEQRAMLSDAAARTRDGVVAATVADAERARTYCADVGSVVLADDEQLAAFTAAAGAVYAALEQDPTTAALIAGIRDLKTQADPGPAIEACQHGPAEEQTSGYAGPVIPDGTYVRVTTEADAAARGLDPAIVGPMLGDDGQLVVVLEIEDGSWTQYEELVDGTRELGDLGVSTYDPDGRWVTVSESGGCRGCEAVIDWSFADGVLSLAFAPGDGEPIPDDARLIVEGDYAAE
jgi:TRAP-type C4-dicarboxylate transport system substrate-binding protein